MKKLPIIIFTIIITSSVIEAQDENLIKNSLNTIFTLSITKNYEKAAEFIAYSGSDSSRYWTDTYKSSDKEELNQVKRICKKIAALNEISDKYKVTSITTKKINNVTVYSVGVNFISGQQQLKTELDFIKLGNKYILTEMN
ncbi:hypothetical protein ABRY23_05020 [Melioribacteraceae bacterium 4301-Me]|uniref:hypothetical protein n=1 Tax=Pyranulibacter aquaticus TaxID=3163344 RepID=UPI003597969F